MKIKGIKYIGPTFDSSGYGQASRGNILALNSLGIPLTLSPISFESAHPDLGDQGQLLKSLVHKDIEYNIVFIHSTPEFWANHREDNKINIGYTIWETTRLHRSWPAYINESVDKVLVGCEWNVDIFKKSGVEVPIGVVPHGINISEFENIEPFSVAGIDKDTFMFYSIFQFTERKSPPSTLKAYWRAFQNNENVALVLKTYRNNFSEEEKNAIRLTINRLKNVCPVYGGYPKVYFIGNMLSRDEILGLHKRGDCYVSLDRGEGFGLGPFEAGAVGNPVIVTGFGGSAEFAKPDNSYLVNYMLVPCWGMPYSPWYSFSDQDWAEPDILHGAELMRYVYENRTESKEKGKKLQKYISDNFSWKDIGKKIIKEIERMR